MSMVSPFHEVRAGFGSQSAWHGYLQDNLWLQDPSYIRQLVDALVAEGAVDPYLGPTPLNVVGSNYRETLTAHGTNSRMRAMLLELRDNVARAARVYAPEAVTPLASRLREAFPRFEGSEYLPDLNSRVRYSGTRHEDVQHLSYGDDTFDAYVSCDVLEHVPSIAATLAEAARVLRPGGILLATCPFRYWDEHGEVRATIDDMGQVVHLRDPEYHGNPVGSGALVFTVPGWQLLEQCREAGFVNPRMILHSSRRYGITGAAIAGVFVLRAVLA